MSAEKSASGAKKVGPEVFATRAVVVASVRGCPPWPGMIVDPATVPKCVNPRNKKSVVYAIRLFPAGDHVWLGPKDLKRLTPALIDTFMKDTANMEGNLMDGYRTVLDPTAWEAEHDVSPPIGKKQKSQSKAKKGGEDEDDELADAEEEDAEETNAGRKKRKWEAPARVKKSNANTRSSGKAKKSKAPVESEAYVAGQDGDWEAERDGTKERASKKSKGNAHTNDVNAKMEPDPEALKVREWKHKLQKTFSSKVLPKEDEMPAVDMVFTTVEGYDNMSIGYLSFSKIDKVMRHIHLLDAYKVPRDEEFHFRDRAKALVDKCHETVGPKANAGGGDTERDGTESNKLIFGVESAIAA
ncbi:hypothetical protein B0H12DRAFT_1019877, partial [Mycena haematopus]